MSKDEDEMDFWLDNSEVKESDISDDSDIPLPEAPSVPSPKATTPKRTDITVRAPKEKISPIKTRHAMHELKIDSDDSSDPIDIGTNIYKSNTRPETSIESQSISFVTDHLRAELEQLKREREEPAYKPKRVPIVEEIHDQLQPGAKTIIFRCDEDDFHERYVLSPGMEFQQLFNLIPDKYFGYDIILDGLKIPKDEVLVEIIEDFSEVVLKKPTEKLPDKSLSGKKKLAFVLPDGEKKKVALDPKMTFADALIKLELPKARLMFDGETINLNQRIIDNRDIEDGDQLDVVM